MSEKTLNTVEPLFRGIAWALLLVGLTTVAMFGVVYLTGLPHGSVIYLIAVVVAAIRWGLVSALTAVFAGLVASAYFFYPPVLSFRVKDPQQAIDLALFVFVAIVTSHLATQLSAARVRDAAESFRQAVIDSVSHELRTPLASIVGAATVLHGAPAIAEDRRLKDLVSIVHSEAERLNDDIGNLLDASRISRDGVQPRLEWTDPADIVNSAIERSQRRLSDHRIDLEMGRDLPLAHIDPVLARQALVQVLDNAAKYSPPGSPIGISVRPARGAVHIEVRDSGVGLTSDEKANLWQRFYRGDRSAVGGSGLGLWIARAFVAATGGSIAADSAGAGRGTTLTIELPAPHNQPSPESRADV